MRLKKCFLDLKGAFSSFSTEVYVFNSLDRELSSCFMDSSFINDEGMNSINFDVLRLLSIVFIF